MMTVMAVDPGLTTGWVVFEPVDRLEVTVLKWGETTGAQEFCQLAWDLAESMELDYIVCEDFVPRKDQVLTWRPESLWIIGMLRWLITPEKFALQMVGDAMSWGTETKTKPYTTGRDGVGFQGEGHARMALKHALLWTANGWKGQ